ncbi:helix-turn-helix transcriptional regulator [Actinospica robiniae]|uniref:helix-turn-helix transcriptional regulator n=1 Tax=Actinospica robiniae TaxID=304901 RepID=UPI000A033FCF|nr:helix-turn-helix transcriptional regulator [Actinospica robiniae]
MSVGALIYERRTALNWTQDDLALHLNSALPEPTVTRTEVARWESGKRVPSTEKSISALSQVLGIPMQQLRAASRLSKVDRRNFLSLAALTTLHGGLAGELYASLASGDAVPLASVQTSHGVDLVLASLVEPSSHRKLTAWAQDGGDPVLRVNAAGILAKLPAQDANRAVAAVLSHDAETRDRYLTAVIARVFKVDWCAAQRLAADPAGFSHPDAAARLLAAEALNPRDAGARWCAANLLRDLSPMIGA